MKNIILSAVSIACSCILSFGMFNIIHQDRSVTVRGLSEREVAADMAVWPLTFNVGSNTLAELQAQVAGKTGEVSKFLLAHGLEESDFTVQAANITDTTTNVYMNHDAQSFKYIAKQTVLIRSSKIEQVKSALSDSLQLAGKGIAVAQEYDSKISYEFTGLNAIKPEMIAEATKNAHAAAEQFAKDSNSKVGKIKKATQGLFSIEDAAVGLEERKTVRVVTSVEYCLR